MFKHFVAFVLALAFVAAASNASAYIDTPYITPAAPFADQPVSVNIDYGVCDLILGVIGTTQDGNAIHIHFSGVHYDDPFMCNLSSGVGVFTVGAYPQGDYTLQVDFFYYSTTGIPETIELGTFPFSVAGSTRAAIAAPINSLGSLGCLALFVLCCAMWRLRASAIYSVVQLVVLFSPGARAQDNSGTETEVVKRAVLARLIGFVAGLVMAERVGSEPTLVSLPRRFSRAKSANNQQHKAALSN